MSRPLIQRRIDELEAMFDAEQGNPYALSLLENELAFRSVPRASTLLNKVKRVLVGETVSIAPEQDELFAHEAAVAVQVPLLRISPFSTPASIGISIEEACKVLHVTAGASWEAVESSRREIVDRAHPAKLSLLKESHRTTIMLEATRANAAYAVLRKRGTS